MNFAKKKKNIIQLLARTSNKKNPYLPNACRDVAAGTSLLQQSTRLCYIRLYPLRPAVQAIRWGSFSCFFFMSQLYNMLQQQQSNVTTMWPLNVKPSSPHISDQDGLHLLILPSEVVVPVQKIHHIYMPCHSSWSRVSERFSHALPHG